MPKNPRFSPNATRTIEVVTFPGVQLLDVTGPVQVFAFANDLAARAGDAPPYQVKLVTQGGQVVASSAGVTLGAASLSGLRATLDTLLVAGGPGVENSRYQSGSGRLAATAGGTGAPRCVCLHRSLPARRRGFIGRTSGGDPLEGLRQTGRTLSRGARRARSDLCVRRQVWTSAGVTAGIDLALAFVEEDLGSSMALAVARYMVVFLKRPGGQAQFSAALALQSAGDKFGALHDWINRHLDDDLSLSSLADQAGHERAQLQPALCRGDWSDAGPGHRAAEGGGRAASAFRVAPAHQTDRATLRLPARRKQCVAVSCAWCRSRRRNIAPGSVFDHRGREVDALRWDMAGDLSPPTCLARWKFGAGMAYKCAQAV